MADDMYASLNVQCAMFLLQSPELCMHMCSYLLMLHAYRPGSMTVILFNTALRYLSNSTILVAVIPTMISNLVGKWLLMSWLHQQMRPQNSTSSHHILFQYRLSCLYSKKLKCKRYLENEESRVGQPFLEVIINLIAVSNTGMIQ